MQPHGLGKQRGAGAKGLTLPRRLETFAGVQVHCRSVAASGTEAYSKCISSACPINGCAKQQATKPLATKLGRDPHLIDIHERCVRCIDLCPGQTRSSALYLSNEREIQVGSRARSKAPSPVACGMALLRGQRGSEGIGGLCKGGKTKLSIRGPLALFEPADSR